MSNSRRDFLKLGILGSLGLASPKFSNAQSPKYDELNSDSSWKDVQAQFTLNKDRVFMNNGTLGPSPKIVQDELIKQITKYGESGIQSSGTKLAREALAGFAGVKYTEIALTRNVTEGINIIARGVQPRRGDEIILSKEEHVGNGVPWLFRAKQEGWKVRAVDLGNSAQETFDNIKKLTNRRTCIIAVPHILCTTGQVLPIKEIATFAKSNDILTAIDGAHGPGMMNMDLRDLGVDYYSSCAHKWMLGPKGTGFVYLSSDSMNSVQPTFVGGDNGMDWHTHKEEVYIQDDLSDKIDARRYFYGTQNSALYKGIVKAVDFHLSIGKDRIEKRLRSLNQQLFQGLEELGERIEILTPEEKISRCAVVSFRVPNRNNFELYKEIREQGFILRYVAESELNCIRISTHIYNDEDQIKELIKTLEKLL